MTPQDWQNLKDYSLALTLWNMWEDNEDGLPEEVWDAMQADIPVRDEFDKLEWDAIVSGEINPTKQKGDK